MRILLVEDDVLITQTLSELLRGEFVAIMEPSGSEKSTLMNILGLLDSPTLGSYFLEGLDVSTLNDNELSYVRGRRIGFVF